MPLEKPYAGLPGTTIFDADQSRKGYWLNQFCMSLMKAENRARFKQDERAYLDQWPMTEEQKQPCWRATETAASRWAATSISWPRSAPTDGKSFQQMAAPDRHERGGLPRHDGRRRPAGHLGPRRGEE